MFNYIRNKIESMGIIDMGLLKFTVGLIGIIIGAYISEYVKEFLPFFIAFATVGYITLMWRFFRK